MMIAERKNTRGRIEILASILFHCKEGIKKTHIMCKANLGYEQLSYYLPNLIDTDLIRQDIENGFVIYRTTDTGREYLEYYFGIMRLLSKVRFHGMSAMTSPESSLKYRSNVSENRPLISINEETDD
jgi:predicted transcriptional regulator